MTRAGIRPTAVLSLAIAFAVAASVSPPAHGQTNYISLNNGGDVFNYVAGLPGTGANPNLYYRCFSRELLYPPIPSSGGLDVTGFQITIGKTLYEGGKVGFPIAFFVEDPSLSCILSAAIGGGFPPNKAKILQSPNTLASFYFYSSLACVGASAWWLAFTGSATAFQAPDPGAGGGNLLAGWSAYETFSPWNHAVPIYSNDETASAKSRSFMNLNAAGMGNFRLAPNEEWDLELILREPTVQPEITRPGGTWDLRGSGGYSPAVGPGRRVRLTPAADRAARPHRPADVLRELRLRPRRAAFRRRRVERVDTAVSMSGRNGRKLR